MILKGSKTLATGKRSATRGHGCPPYKHPARDKAKGLVAGGVRIVMHLNPAVALRLPPANIYNRFAVLVAFTENCPHFQYFNW